MKIDLYNTNKKYKIIYADPPWRYRDLKVGGITYPTMTIDEICALPISSISDSDSILFMWATMPLLPEALKVINAWGFRYTTCAFTWVKQNPKNKQIFSGLGRWTRGNAELCLLAKKGHPKRISKNVKQIVLSPRGKHSAKPIEVRDRIVSLIGDLPRIELFAREECNGWDAFGNEV